MNTDSYEYQYPPELLLMLIDVIPKLHKSKDAILLFFTNAGVDETDLQAGFHASYESTHQKGEYWL